MKKEITEIVPTSKILIIKDNLKKWINNKNKLNFKNSNFVLKKYFIYNEWKLKREGILRKKIRESYLKIK